LPIHIQSAAEVWLVGDGPERRHLELLAEELDIVGRVRFCGHVGYSDLFGYFEQSDVFVLPTRSDYRALVGFEALSMGMPLLVSKFDGASEEIIDQGENGYIFDPHDTPHFTNLLQWFALNTDSLAAFRRRSSKKASEYTFDRAAKTLVSATLRCMS
jgi:glycosyltransferase involved in cell wall biosynthesis